MAILTRHCYKEFVSQKTDIHNHLGTYFGMSADVHLGHTCSCQKHDKLKMLSITEISKHSQVCYILLLLVFWLSIGTIYWQISQVQYLCTAS